MNKSYNIGTPESTIDPRHKSLRSLQELRSISKELIFKRPKDIKYNRSLLQLDDSDLMTRHRCNFINAKLKQEKERAGSLLPDVFSSTQNLFNYSNELVNTLGTEKPEVIFKITTDLSELRRQIEQSQFEILKNLDFSFNIPQVLPKKRPALRPVGRKDVEILEDWLDFMLQQISSKSENIFEDAQIVYSAVLQDLINQVKVNCLERGKLLERVWTSYFSLMIAAIKQYQTSNLGLKVKTSANIKLLESKYKETISNLQFELSESISQLASAKYSADSLTKTIEKYKMNEKLHQTKLNVVLSKYEKDKVKLLRLEDTNNNLKHLLRTVLDDIDSDMPGLKKMREKHIIRFRNISEILISDPVLASRNESLDLSGSAQDMEDLVEKQRVELENKIFLQEIKEQMIDTEEEMDDKEVNTTIKEYKNLKTQTDLQDFPIPSVQVEKEEVQEKFGQFHDFIAGMLNNENMAHEERLKAFYNFDEVEQDSDTDELRTEMISFGKKEFQLISLDRDTYKRAKKVIQGIHNQNSMIFLELKRKLNYQKIKKQKCLLKLKELRKMLFSVVNENLELKQKLRSGSLGPGRKIVKKQGARKKLTITKEFAIGKRRSLAEVQEDKEQPDFSTVNFLTNLVMSGKFKEKLSISKRGMQKILNNFIHDIISLSPEDIKSITSPNHYFFSYISSKFPIKAIAKANYAQYLLALKTYKGNNKTFKLFSRLLGLSESLDVDYFYTFIELFKVLMSSCHLHQILTDSNEEVFIALHKCEEAVESYWKGKILENEMQDLKKSLQKVAIACPKNFNRTGVVHQADFLEANLRTYVFYLEHSKHQVKDLFDSMDLDNDGFLNFEEFQLIFRNLEKKSFTEFYANSLFTAYADIVAESNGVQYPAISYLKFAALSAEKGLFQNEAQEQLLQVEESGVDNALEQIFLNHAKIFKNIEWKINRLREASGFMKEKLGLLKECVLKGRKSRNVLIAFRLLDDDTRERLVALEIGKFMPSILKFYEKTQGMIAIDRNPPRRELKNLAMLDENDEGALF